MAEQQPQMSTEEMMQGARKMVAEILLAKKADEVVRVICGIGQKIK